MKVYVASSWRNTLQPDVVAHLRAEGFDVYDFKNDDGRGEDFHWRDIDPKWETWSARETQAALEHPLCVGAFAADMQHLTDCDALVYVQPCGVSASLELGWAVGKGIPAVVLLADDACEPELMLKMATSATSLAEVVAELRRAL